MSEFRLHPKLAQDCFFVNDLNCSQLLLMNDRRYPWFILVPRVPDLRELFEVPRETLPTLIDEMNRLSAFVFDLDGVTKTNVAALGNQVSQLHIHVIGRNPSDAAWPGPVWGIGEAISYQPEQATEMKNLVQHLY